MFHHLKVFEKPEIEQESTKKKKKINFPIHKVKIIDFQDEKMISLRREVENDLKNYKKIENDSIMNLFNKVQLYNNSNYEVIAEKDSQSKE